jgi:FixJ family two-component response regulator
VLLGAIEQALLRSGQEAAENIKIANIQRRINSLTPRELEVMKLLITGMLNKQVAYILGTEKTIKVYRARVLDKMGAGSVVGIG